MQTFFTGWVEKNICEKKTVRNTHLNKSTWPWWLVGYEMCHWRASSFLFMPNGCNVLALCIKIKWASRAFLTESRLLRMSSIEMRLTSLIEWPAWLNCSDIGVVVLSCWWIRTERRCSRGVPQSVHWVNAWSPMYWRWPAAHLTRIYS